MTFEIIFVLLALLGMVIAWFWIKCVRDGALFGGGTVSLCWNPDT